MVEVVGEGSPSIPPGQEWATWRCPPTKSSSLSLSGALWGCTHHETGRSTHRNEGKGV
jgi:hypothetical protein